VRPVSIHAAIDPAVFDAALLAGIQRMIPPARLHAYLLDLDLQLLRINGAAAGAPELQGQAHKIVSQAGMLGLTRVSDSARALEDACRSGCGQAAARRQCRAAAGDIQKYAMPAAQQARQAGAAAA
jgi:HPt (histidine-containing phosphotransfer) domain-containing protein